MSFLAGACGSGPGITPIRTAFNRGVYHQSRGELDAAIAEYRAALAADPDDQRARFNLAAALDEQGRARRTEGNAAAAATLLADAERLYRAVPADSPAGLRAGVNLAALEFERGEATSGRARLQAAIAAHPDLALPRTALALRLLDAGDLDGAAVLLGQAIEVDPTDPGANLLLGRLAARRGDVAAARRAFRTVLQREPFDAGALLALARVESGAGNGGEALVLLRELLLQQPQNLAAHLELLELHEQRGELEDAVYHCWQARDLDRGVPPHLDYRARLAGLYRRLLDGADGSDGNGAPARTGDVPGDGRR